MGVRKREFVILFVVIGIFAIALAIAEWSAQPVSHDSESVKVVISGKNYSLQEAIDNGLMGSISCNWNGWKGALTMTINNAAKYASSYKTTIFKCQSGKITSIQYVSCSDANNATYNAGIDCSE